MVHSQAVEGLDRKHVKSKREDETAARSHGGGIKHDAGRHHHHHHHRQHHHHSEPEQHHETAHEAAIASAEKLHESANEGTLGETLIEVEDEGDNLLDLQMHLQPFAMTKDTGNGKSPRKEDSEEGGMEEEPLEESNDNYKGNDGISFLGEGEKVPRDVEVSLEEGSDGDVVENGHEERGKKDGVQGLISENG